MSIKLLRILAVLVVIPSMWVTASRASQSDNGLAGEYLNYEFGARASGMAGAMTGLADDVTAIFYNPAGLARQNPIQIGLQHVLLFADTMFDFLGFTLPVPGFGNIGMGAIMLTSTGFDVRDENYLPLNISNSIQQGALYLSYARDITPQLAIGANAKVAYENIFGRSDTGLGLDVGGLYQFVPEFQVGVYLNNALAPEVLGEAYFATVTLGVGSQLFNHRLKLAADISKSWGNQTLKWCLGGELAVFEERAFVRAGLDEELRVTLGAGGKYADISLDYALSLEDLGLTHKISAGYAFGGYETKIRATPKIFSPVGIKQSVTYALTSLAKYFVTKWELNIKDLNGDVVRTFQGEENPPQQIVWAGKDDRRLPVPDGPYQAQLLVTDEHGNINKSNIETVRIETRVGFGEESELEIKE